MYNSNVCICSQLYVLFGWCLYLCVCVCVSSGTFVHIHIGFFGRHIYTIISYSRMIRYTCGCMCVLVMCINIAWIIIFPFFYCTQKMWLEPFAFICFLHSFHSNILPNTIITFWISCRMSVFTSHPIEKRKKKKKRRKKRKKNSNNKPLNRRTMNFTPAEYRSNLFKLNIYHITNINHYRIHIYIYMCVYMCRIKRTFSAKPIETHIYMRQKEKQWIYCKPFCLQENWNG